MTNDVPNAGTRNFPPQGTALSGAEAAGALDDDVDTDAGAGVDQAAHDDRLSKLPPEEHDDDRTTGGGMLSEGGTAIARGTGTLSGEAQDRDVEADDENRSTADLDDELAYPSEPAGGTH
ncbi:MAG TPA: hypothetical protein VFI28_07985 [Candidatus Limnocylindrales bacterium]|nr:hypothetical protein [Candidatus Limnocylindrales bacterium]